MVGGSERDEGDCKLFGFFVAAGEESDRGRDTARALELRLVLS